MIWRKNQSGMSLVEVLSAVGVLSVIVFALMSSLDLARKAMEGSAESLELAAMQSELAQNMQNSFALGAGYNSATANTINPDTDNAQPVTILDATSGTVAAYTGFNGNPLAAPATAKYKNYIINSIRLRKKSSVSGAGDIGGMQVISDPTNPAIRWDRRALMMDLEVEVRPTQVSQQKSQNIAALVRSIPVSVLVERPAGSGGTWKIAKVGSAEGLSFNVGWRDVTNDDDCNAGPVSNGTLLDASNTVPPGGNTPPDPFGQIPGRGGFRGRSLAVPIPYPGPNYYIGPANAGGADNGFMTCPVGTFMTSQRLDYKNDAVVRCYSCGKGCSFCRVEYETLAQPIIKCCKVRM